MGKRVTPEVVFNVKELHEAGLKQARIAQLLSLGSATVSRIIGGKYDPAPILDTTNTTSPEPIAKAWELARISDKLDQIIGLLTPDNVRDEVRKAVKRSKRQTEYNKFVATEFTKYPNTTMSEVAKKWKAGKQRRFF